MDLGLKGLKAIVTGGSKGIGLKVVELLAAEGCDVGFCARGKAGVEAVAKRLEGAPGRVVGGVADVTESQGFRAWVTQTAQDLGGLDILVANASALGPAAKEEDWREGLEIDVLGTVRAVEAAMPFLEKSEHPSIVGLASAGAINTVGNTRAYGALKAAMINYLSQLATNLGPKGIRANTVSPGAIFFEGGIWDKRKKEQPEMYEKAIARSPFKRFGRPEEVANAVVFLASPAASYISGTNLMVDGSATTRVQF
jgi:3-oxoacyl-[acyl-carrier protein] reductase